MTELTENGKKFLKNWFGSNITLEEAWKEEYSDYPLNEFIVALNEFGKYEETDTLTSFLNGINYQKKQPASVDFLGKSFIFKGITYYTTRLLAEQKRKKGERIYYSKGLGYHIIDGKKKNILKNIF